MCQDFLGGTVARSTPANAGDPGSIPGPGRYLMPLSNISSGATTTELKCCSY